MRLTALFSVQWVKYSKILGMSVNISKCNKGNIIHTNLSGHHDCVDNKVTRGWEKMVGNTDFIRPKFNFKWDNMLRGSKENTGCKSKPLRKETS